MVEVVSVSNANILFIINELDYADHIAIAYLSAIAKQHNFNTFFGSLRDNDCLDLVKKYNPKIIAYSVNSTGYENIKQFNDFIKDKYDFISILGGPQATFFPESFNESGVDIYCIGEGELAFNDFLTKFKNGESFDNIENFITKNKINDVRCLITDLDRLPFPDRDLTISNSFLKNSSKKTFYTTRGCSFKCKYCANNYLRKLYLNKGKIVRRFSVDRIIEEMLYVKSKYKMDFVKIGDDLFASKADEWLEKFSREYSKKINVPFNCYLRLDLINDDLLKLLKQARCYSVHLSLDSCSKFIREEMLGRRMRSTNEEVIINLNKIRSYGINIWVNFMLCNPESTFKDDVESIYFSKKANITYPAYSITVPMKGTELYDYSLSKNYINPIGYKSDMDNTSLSKLSCFTLKDKKNRYNIYLLGALISKLPYFLINPAILLIKIIPPNKIFNKIRQIYYNYNINNKIFKIFK